MHPALLLVMVLFFTGPVEAQTPTNFPQADGHYRKGLAYGEQGHFAQAVDELARAVALNPNHLEAHYYLGGAYAELGRFDQAIAAYQRVLALQPDDLDAHYDLSRLYLQRKQYDLAWQHARAVERRDPALGRELFTALQRVWAPPK